MDIKNKSKKDHNFLCTEEPREHCNIIINDACEYNSLYNNNKTYSIPTF